MKVCKICGKAMDDNFNVCPYCGSVAEKAEQQENNQPENENFYQQNQYSNVPPYGQEQPFNDVFPGNADFPEYTPAPRPQRSAYVAGFLAIFLGMFGIHNFYLDRKKRALTQLLITVIGSVLTFGCAAFAMAIWGLIEGIKILKGEINTDGTGAMIKMGF